MNSLKRILLFLLKFSVFVGLIVFIYFRIKKKFDEKGISFQDALDYENIHHSDNFYLLWFAIFLVFVNWGLEFFKWKVLVNSILPKFTYWQASLSVLMGLCLGFVTPKRIGEFGGRLFNIKEGYKIKGVSLAVRGGMAQFIVTFSFGLVSALFVYKDEMFSNNIVYVLLFISVFILMIFYYQFNPVIKIFSSIKFFKKFINFEYIDLFISNKKLTEIFVITILRYFVYINQYILLCYFFSIEVNYLLLFSIVCTMIFIQTLGPSMPILDLPIRGGVLLELLVDHTDNQLNILFVILLVWILNLVLPAIVGYLGIISLKMEGNNEKGIFNNFRINKSQ